MTRNRLIFLAAGGSAALLIAALAFQYVGGMAPCSLCIWQRWPHLVAMLAAPLALLIPSAIGPVAGGVAAATSGGIGIYHTGVERGWWQGPQACSADGDIGALSTQELMEQIMAAPVVRCDEVPWEMLGLSMASWNAVASFALVGIWMWALAVPRDRQQTRPSSQ